MPHLPVTILAGVLLLGGLILVVPDLAVWLAGALFAAPLALPAAAGLLLLPGLALIRWLAPADLALAERLALALSVSVAVPPLLFLYADLVGLRWSPALAWLFLLFCALAAFWPVQRAVPLPRPDRHDALLLLITMVALVLRLFAARDLAVGQWGDSYHHTLITQLMAENGGLFRSWEPYAPMITLTYHMGFHAGATWLHWLSGLAPPQAVVGYGQLLSSAAAPLAYLLSVRLGASRTAGLWAAIVMALVALMPSYFVNWGRYTQLSGHTVLIAVCVVWMQLIDRAVQSNAALRTLAGLIALAALTLAGLLLCHYRIGAFAACFVVVYGLYLLATQVRALPLFGRLSAAGVLAAGGALLLTLPWLLRLNEGTLLRYAGHLLTTNIGTGDGNSYSWNEVALALRSGLLPLGLLGVVAALVGRKWPLLLLPLWAALVWVAANPFLIGLNGAGLISGFAALLGAYIVLAPLAGLGIAWLFELIGAGLTRVSQLRPAATLITAGLHMLAALALLVWAAPWQAAIVDRSFQLFTPADMVAAEWLEANTSPDARIFVNGFGAYGGTVYVGTDGGWWLPLMAERRTNIEPITYAMEAGPTADYYAQVYALNQELTAHPLDDPATAAALKAAGFRYLYNSPAANPPAEYLDPQVLAASPLYEQVFAYEGATIWLIR
ncbi:MAG: hypothetical protein HC822_21785 [Oscillochloris sp.]|nr:hypothetical protein [Oscillochloris sp.]